MSPLTAPAPPPNPISVHGGSGGITAQCDEIRAMAGRFGGVATESLHSAWTLHGYLVHPAIVESAAFDPLGFAMFESDLVNALDGLQGLSWVGAESGLVDGELRVAATAYETADHLYNKVRDEVLGLLDLPYALLDGAGVLANTGNPLAAADSVVADDPELADTLIDTLGLPGVIAGLSAVLPDGHGVVHSLGRDTLGVAGRPPRRLTDIVRDLAQRNNDGHHGAIDVRILTMPDGSRKVIVDITGTKTWTLQPTNDITSITTNGRALVGEQTAYEQGVRKAMHQAGVRSTDDVMLVGHSEGGMVAVNTARDVTKSGEFNVTHVVTAGSPIGLTVGSVPAKVQVLALENGQDVVPHLDGAANPDAPNVTTASSTRGDGTVGGDHSIDGAYVPLAGDVQVSGNGSVRTFLTTAGGYFHATGVTTHTYQVTRHY